MITLFSLGAGAVYCLGKKVLEKINNHRNRPS